MTFIWNEARALWRARMLVWVLTRREVASRHTGTALGIVWPYLQPLLTVAAYYLVFDVVFGMRLGDQAPTRAVGAYLVVGALPWMAFCDAVQRGMTSLIDAGSLLHKNPLPPVLFTSRTVFGSFSIYGPLLLLVAMAYLPAHGLKPAILALLPLLLLQMVLCLVMGYALAILAAALRDVAQLVGFLLSVGIYLSPILFPIQMFPEGWRWVLWLNPMTGLVMGYQQVLLQGQWPDWSAWCATLVWLGTLAVILNGLVARSRDQLVDWL